MAPSDQGQAAESVRERAPALCAGRDSGAILIVDDDRDLCEGLRDRLGRLGFEVATAASAEAARAQLAKGRFDVLLCDVLMPGGSGLDLVGELASDHPGIGAIMISALDDPDIADAAASLGAYGYLVKPFTSNELLMQVRNALRRVRLERDRRGRARALEEMLATRTQALAAERRLRDVAARQSRENARLLVSVDERRKLVELLTRIQRSIAHRLALDSVLDQIVDGAAGVVPDAGVVLHLRSRDGAPGAVNRRRIAAELAAQLLERPAGEAIADRRLVVEHVSHPDGARWAMAAPVHEAGTAVGALTLVRGDERAFGELERDALDAFAEHASVALTDASTLRRLADREALLARLTAVQRSISRRAPLPEILDLIVEGTQQLLHDELVAVTLVEKRTGRLTLAASRGLGGECLDLGGGEDDVCRRAIRDGEPVVCDAASATFPGPSGIAAAMAVPIRESGRVVGALVVGSSAQSRSWSEPERHALVTLAEHAGLALGDARSRTIVHDTFHDPLTGLPNRVSFLEHVDHASGDAIGVALINLDGFRSFSAGVGQVAAARILVAVARRIRACAPAGAVAARLGHDEFGILVEGASLPDMEALGDAVVAAIDTPFDGGVELTASVGVASADPRVDDVFRDAAVALYRAKRRGNGHCETFTSAMLRALLGQFDLESDLEGAVERGEIRVVYQPVVRLRDGRTVGVEALARWDHPRRGVISPAEFIPLAEELDLIETIGEHVVNVALEQLAAWRERGLDLWASVNVSARELEHEAFADKIAGALERAQLEPGALLVEITERVLIGDIRVASEQLERLRARGVRIALDDFGTGHSSLEYVRSLPFDVLKIAREYCDGADRSAEEAALVRTLVEVARRFDLDVIAEGIERAEQCQALIDAGCELGQGYHFARPLDPEAAELFANAHAAAAPR